MHALLQKGSGYNSFMPEFPLKECRWDLRTRRILMITPDYYSYGGLLISGVMEANGYQVSIEKNIDNALLNFPKVDVLCLSLQSTTHLFDCRKLLKNVKKEKLPFVIVGGSAVQDPAFTFNILPEVDVVVIGEGEETVLELLDSGNRDAWEDTAGIAFQREEHVVTTRKRKAPKLEWRPFPKVPKTLGNQWIRDVNIYIETHRGCLANCTFCQYCHVFGHDIRSRPLEDIIQEVRHFKARGIKKIAISGGDVSYYGLSQQRSSKEPFIELIRTLSSIIGRDNLAGPDIRIDSLTSDVLESIRKYTHGWIFVGIESGSNKILRTTAKGISVDDIYQGVELAKTSSVSISGSFITGFANETYDDFLRTRQLVSDLKLDHYEICIAEPVPATPYWNVVKSLPLSENPLITPYEESIPGVGKVSAAEYQALELRKIAYETIHSKPIDPNALREEFLIIHRESKRIERIVKELVSQSKIPRNSESF